VLDYHDLIFSYSRAEAISNGDLIEVDRSILKDAGITLPSVLSIALFTSLEPSEEEALQGQSFSGRLWDLLMVFIALAKGSNEGRLEFEIFLAETKGIHTQRVVAVCGPDDDLKPCLTFMTPGCE
jgi:hypothetical protein